MSRLTDPIDVWFKFDSDEDETPTYEANTFKRGDHFIIGWYHNDVGLVTEVRCDTLAEAHAWYERQGYIDMSS